MTSMPRPTPHPDRDSTEWWAALQQHRLVLQGCSSCTAVRWPPRVICGRCGSMEWAWQPSAGRGTVVSWIVNWHSFAPAFQSPYVVLLVRLDDQDDVVLTGSWSGDPQGRDLSIAQPVVVGYDDIDDGAGSTATLLRWGPAEPHTPTT